MTDDRALAALCAELIALPAPTFLMMSTAGAGGFCHVEESGDERHGQVVVVAVLRGGRWAVIGEIADDDAGKGAAYGAAVGAVAGRRGSRRASAESQQQAQQQSDSQQQASAEEIGNFNNAFSACLEGRNYLVKF